MPKLVITDGEGTREVALKDGDTLGRVAQNAVVLKVSEASRTHCKFSLEKNAWFVEDLGSSNGTQVNGRKVTKFELQDGDVISIGKVELRFLESDLVAAPAASGSDSWGDDDISLEERVFFVLGGAKREGELINVPEGRLTVGRNAKHAFQIKDASISGDHAEIHRQGTKVTVKDLGSSNGTFINDRRVQEGELHSEDVLRFGTVPCRFGIGDPKDFVAPAAVEATEDSAASFTRAVPAPGEAEDTSFEMSAAAPKARDTLWNLISLVVILGLGGGAAWLMMQSQREKAQGGALVLERGANLLPESSWSFELAEGDAAETAVAWAKEDAADPSSMGETADIVRSGKLAYDISRAQTESAPSIATLSANVQVSFGTAYRLSVWSTGAGAIPVVGLIWFDAAPPGETEAVELARTTIFGRTSGPEWIETSGVVVPPDGVDFARVFVGAAGPESVTLDDVRLESTGVPLGRAREIEAFRATMDPHGTLRLSRYGRGIFDGLGIAANEAGRLAMQPELLIVNPEVKDEGRIAGSLRNGKGDLAASLVQNGERLSYTLKGPGLAAAGSIVIPLVPRVGVDLEVTLLHGDSGRRYRESFQDVPATSLIVGSGGDRAKIDFQSAGNTPIALNATLGTVARQPAVILSVGSASELALDFQLTFKKEEEEGRELLRAAGQAAREQKSGEAILMLETGIARLPFEAKFVEDATKLLGQLTTEARTKADQLKSRLDNAKFFRDLSRDDALASAILAEKARYAGTSVSSNFDALEKAVDDARKQLIAPRRAEEAERILGRARDYLDGKRPSLALLFLDAVRSGYSGTDEADAAETLIKRAQGDKGGNGRNK